MDDDNTFENEAEIVEVEDDFDDEDYDDSMDGDHESALESVFGPEDSYLDAAFEDRYEMDMGDF